MRIKEYEKKLYREKKERVREKESVKIAEFSEGRKKTQYCLSEGRCLGP